MRRWSGSRPVARAIAVSAVSATTMLTAAVAAAVGGVGAGAASRPADASAPTMAQTFTKSLAPVPSFLASAGSKLSLTQQTIAGMAAQKYGETPGLTAKQAQAVPAGFLSSLAYPLAKTGTQPKVIASAVGVLTSGNSTPEQPGQPGCTPNTGGNVSRVSVIKKNATYRLVITKTEQDSFAPLGSWRLPTYSTGGPTDVTVLDPNCAWSGPSAVAVTYPGGIDFYAFDGSAAAPPMNNGVLVPATSWLPSGTVLASAHANADSSYFSFSNVDSEGGGDESNAQMLAVTRTAAGAVTLHELTLNGFHAGWLSDAAVPVGTMDGAKPRAAIAYDNDDNRTADYALAVRAGGKLGVWFGVILGNPSGNSANTPQKQVGACAGTGLPSLSVADADAGGNGSFNGVACANTTATGVRIERWSNYIHSTGTDAPGGYPGGLHKPVMTALPRLAAPQVFVTWPCELLSDWAQDQSPQLATCTSDMAADVIGTPAKQVARIYQLPTLGRKTPIASRPIAGVGKGAVPAVDQLPLDDTTITVHNDSPSAKLVDSNPVPLVYLMPAPVVHGLHQPIGGAPVSFGTTQGSGTGSSASFSTSVGGTVSATIGEPAIAAVDLSVSAEQSTGHTSSSESQVSSTQSLNDNANEPFVVYQVTPEWRWTGEVTADSSGLGVSHAAKVITQIAATDHGAPQLYADSVHQLSSRFPAFRRSGMYGPTLTSVFGAGVFGGKARTVADADPGAYPSFVPGRSTAPQFSKVDYCDTHSGGRGVTSVNSGVSSPYTPADGTATGPSFLTPDQGYRTVQVGDSESDSQSVTISSSQSDAYSSQFSVNASAGVTVGGVSVTADAGFTEGNETSVTTSSGQTFAVEVGHITGASRAGLPGGLARAIDKALARTETYSWEPFICHRTTDLPGGGQTSALVLGFATNGFHGLAAVPAPSAPRALIGGTSAGRARAVRPGSKLTFVHSGAAATFRIQITPRRGRGTTVNTPVLTPAQAAKAARRQSVSLPRSVTAGIYRWRAVAVSFNGDQKAGAWRWIRVR